MWFFQWDIKITDLQVWGNPDALGSSTWLSSVFLFLQESSKLIWWALEAGKKYAYTRSSWANIG